jgi:hypothetical protein
VSPTAEHEALHRVFREDEVLFAHAMSRVFNIEVSPPGPGGVTVLSTDLTETEPMERRPDSVLQVEFLVEDAAGKYILVLESQTEPDEERRRRWPHFVAHLHDKYDCPVVLAVVCSKRYTASWAREPIRIGLPGVTCLTATLVVFGPDNVPPITDPAEAAGDLVFAVFSALTHSRSRAVGGILEALVTALGTIDEETASNLAEFTETGLADTVGGQIWRTIMATRTFPFVSQTRLEGRAEGKAEGKAEGRAESKAEDILKILSRRGIEVDDDSRQKIESCTDLDVLDGWFDRSFDAASATDLFK